MLTAANQKTTDHAAQTEGAEADDPCWICGGLATTGEHKAKRSDIKSIFGKPTQAQPLYFHDARQKNRKVGSLNADPMKWERLICHECNTTRTQPHDRAWERLSIYLRVRKPPLAPGILVHGNQAFLMNTSQEMLNVHLYFVKMFGCAIVEHGIGIDIKGFSTAILTQRAHPDFYLQFGHGPSPGGVTSVSASNGHGFRRSDNGAIDLLVWTYNVAGLRVAMIYAHAEERSVRQEKLWHPRLGTNNFEIAKIE